MIEDAIGGYFGLEVAGDRRECHADALRFQSARAAFLALLRAQQPAAVWVPWYLCDSMLEPLQTTGTTLKRYALGHDLGCPDVEPGDGEWLLYVNYFGICDRHVDDVLARHPRTRVVIDNAHALFSAPRDCLATVYSPRKFVGVPDGGYLVTQAAVPMPDDVDDGSLGRSKHLLTRLAAGAEAGYAEYAAAEASLRWQAPRRMSPLTQRLLADIDYDSVRARRAANFRFLHERLGHRNRLAIRVDDDAAPLCYPFLGAPAGLRDMLRARRVYTPTYWPDLSDSPDMPAFERAMPEATLFLPCDQRLSVAQLAPLTHLLLEQLDR